MKRILVVLIFYQMIIFLTDSIAQDILPDTTEHIPKITEDKWLGKDKFKHFIACLYCAGFTEWMGYHSYGLNKNQSRRAGIIVSMSIGIAKELYDEKRYKKFSWKDIFFDLLGAVCGVLLINNLNM